MESKKLLILIVSVLMVLTIPVIIYGYNFNSVTFDENLYRKEFEKYDVYDNLKDYDIKSINAGVLNYLRNAKNDELIKIDFFNEREKTHLLDVKVLISKVLSIYYFSVILFLSLFISLIILINFKIKKIVKRFLIILIIGCLLALLDAVLFFVLSNFNFVFIFDLFHETFFSFGTYTFNPAYENIVNLYPQNLFFDLLIKMISNTIFSSVGILFLSIAFLFVFFRLNFLKFIRKIPTKKQ